MAALIALDRRIIMVGIAGSGKSTVGNHIMNQEVFRVKSDVYNDTIRSQLFTHILSYKDLYYNVVLIEAPGFFNIRNIDSKSILDDIKSSIKSNAPDGLNLVLFVMRAGRFTTEDADTFNFIIDNFGDNIENISALVITCCENKNTAARKNIVQRFCDADITAKYAKYMKMGIYTVGFPDLSEIDQQEATKMKVRIKKDEHQLLDLITQAKFKYLVEEMQEESNCSKIRKVCTVL